MPPTSTNLVERLASAVGGGRVRSDVATLAAYAVDEVTPGAVVKPASAEEAAEIVRLAIAENLGVVPAGGRTKMGIGMPPMRYDIALDMTALNQIAHYDPGDLTVSVDAGCTLQSIDAALTLQKQFLPLPQGFGEQCTVAGTIASGVDAHWRQFFGTARDFLIGAEFIDGTGARCKSGGRVVKNVTGYDLHKLLIGSLGTLAIITRLNFRTFPSLTSAESQAGIFVAAFPDARGAVAFRQNIAASPFTPDAVELLSPELSKLFAEFRPRSWEKQVTPLSTWFSRSQWNVVVCFHGTPDLTARYVTALNQRAESAGAVAMHALQSAALDSAGGAGEELASLNARISGTARFLRDASAGAAIFKIAQLPAKLPELFAGLAEIAAKANVPHAFCARGVGAVYFALLPKDPAPYPSAAVAAVAPTQQEVIAMDAGLSEQALADLSRACGSIFDLCSKQSATAFIQFAPAALKRRVNVFGPERSDAAAMRRLKSAFDPRNIFAPGRVFT
jgi:glycolate oxidase FAD binding subunit